MYGAMDFTIESFYIVSEQTTSAKWYLKEHLGSVNGVVWTRNIHKAREFDTKDEALKFGSTIGREFFVEEVDGWF